MPQVVFNLPEYDHVGKVLCSGPDCTLGEIDVTQFPDGESGLRIVTPVAGQNVVLVGGTWSDAATMRIYDLGCAIAKYGARSLTMVIPYYGCSTMEKDDEQSGVVVTAKTRARLLSAIPQTHTGNRVLLLDLHSEGIPYYFEGDITAKHIYAKPIIKRAVSTIWNALDKDIVLGATDMGRAKWVESLANDMLIPAAFINKKRINGETTKVLSIGGADVKGKTVIIYDDMVRTGGSLMEASKSYRDAGAANVAVVCTHGVFAGTAFTKMSDSKLFDRIAVTDSHPRAMGLAHLPEESIKVWPTAELFVPFLNVE